MTEPNREPLALVGIGCRFPGGISDLDAFWRLLVEKRSAISGFPEDRWAATRYRGDDRDAISSICTDRAGFFGDLKGFDAGFWGISPREAASMDPQHRWLLETAWEAFEDAGVAPDTQRGTSTGVYVGVSHQEYGGAILQDYDKIDLHSMTGSALSIAANRVSYLFDLRGPSIAIDTACSSALVAFSMACEAIWSGTCSAALAGGSNVLFSAATSIGFSKARMLSDSAESFAFDARANGYVRGEGAVMVLLKPLREAVAANDSIYALVRAVAVNQDGNTSSMTVPGVASQIEMLRQAYGRAGIAPSDVDYVEAHGTGTPVGDPIEAEALGSFLSEGREPDAPCLIGSVKTNIGHLEAASGLAGLVKAALILKHRMVPPNQNFATPNPAIDFERLKLRVADTATPLVRTPLRIGVNSFGFGGTNAHVVLQSAPVGQPIVPVVGCAKRPFVLPISARSGQSLRDMAARYRQCLRGMTDQLGDFCASAGARRQHHAHRLVVAGGNAEELRDALFRWFCSGENAQGAGAGVAEHPLSSLTFVFTGQGSQWPGMGQRLLEREPVFRRTVEEVNDTLEPLAGWSLIDELQACPSASRLSETSVAQPAIFAVQAGLVRLWDQLGIRPAQVVGHSVGEIAAAWCAGIYTLAEATRLVFHRSRLQDRTGGHGRMLAAGISEAEAQELIAKVKDYVQVTAINSPALITLGGDIDALKGVEEQLSRKGRFVRDLGLSYAFHTHQMDPIRADLLAALADLQPQTEILPYFSTVTGGLHDGRTMDAGYWWDNVRQPVLFEQAIRSLIAEGHGDFLEIGPHPALNSSLQACLADQRRPGRVFGSLEREADDTEAMVASLQALHIADAAIDWRAVNQAGGHLIRQPAYAWHYKEHWIETRQDRKQLTPLRHPFLSMRLNTGMPTWQTYLDLKRFSYLNDHKIWNRHVFPASGFVELGLALAREVYPGEPHVVERLECLNAMFLSDQNPTLVEIEFREHDKSFEIRGQLEDDRWQLNARGRLVTASRSVPPSALDVGALQSRMGTPTDRDTFYQGVRNAGYGFGDRFSLIRNVWTVAGEDGPLDAGTETLAEVRSDEVTASEASSYRIHPALLDACLQAAAQPDVSHEKIEQQVLMLPEQIGRAQLYQEPVPAQLWVHTRTLVSPQGTRAFDVAVFSETGDPVARLDRLVVRVAEQSQQSWRSEPIAYQFAWHESYIANTRSHGSAEIDTVDSMRKASTRQRAELADADEARTYCDIFLPEIDQLSFDILVNSLIELGWPYQIGDRFELDEVLETLDIIALYRQFIETQLDSFVNCGLLAKSGEGWQQVAELRESDLEASLADLRQRYPERHADIALLAQAASGCVAALSGQINPVEALFPAGSDRIVRDFYANFGLARLCYRMFGAALAQAFKALPPRRIVRILEVGGGTGGLTRHLLEVLPAHRFFYCFTDIGSSFVQNATREFQDVAGFQARLLDLDADPESQGFAPGSFDIVVASTVMHATSDLRQSLRHVHSLLAPGGAFLFSELTLRDGYMPRVFGLMPGWWLFKDHDVRTVSPLVSASRWQGLLQEAGFDEADWVTPTTDPGYEEHVIVLARTTAQRDIQPELPPAAPLAATLLLLDESGIGEELAAKFGTRGSQVIRVGCRSNGRLGQRPDVLVQDLSRASLAAMITEIGHERIERIVCCWPLDLGVAPMTPRELEASKRLSVHGPLHLLQALIDAGVDDPPRVYFVTRDAQFADPTDAGAGLAATPLIGLCRSANNEFDRLRATVVDLAAFPGPFEVDDLLDEIISDNAETEVAIRWDRRLVQRIERSAIDALPVRAAREWQAGRAAKAFKLSMEKPGSIDGLKWVETGCEEPGPQEVVVQVAAGGLNFRDVMKVLGIYPGEPSELQALGDDFAGHVERVGSEVDSLRVGDRVAGIKTGCFRSQLTCHQELLIRLPDAISFEEGATIPTLFLTAHYALRWVGRVQAGEWILIHAGAGGVGQAAINIAQGMGLQIIATVGSERKRQFLRSQGIEHIASSRDLSFADDVMRITEGKGVDVVLNSLSGEFLQKSIGVVGPLGRFLELGKIDIYRNSKLGLFDLKHNASFHVIDLAQLTSERRDLSRKLIGEVRDCFARGEYAPLPFSAFPIRDVKGAFRQLASGQHIGKNVLLFSSGQLVDDATHAGAITVEAAAKPEAGYERDASYLIAGGASGLGFELAKSMIEGGAGRVVVMSRSGPSAEITTEIGCLRAAGSDIVETRGDLSDLEDVRRAMALANEARPLRGVVHSALVLDDRMIMELDDKSFDDVLDPKMKGAWNLHLASLDYSLDEFVMFSSLASYVGSPLQANYVAANHFLNALAQYRQAQGLPARAIAWGAIDDKGIVARNEATARYVDAIGLVGMRAREACDAFHELTRRSATSVAIARVDWHRLKDVFVPILKNPTFASIARGLHEAQDSSSLKATLAGTAAGQRSRLIEEFLASQVARVFGISEAEIDRRTSLNNLGIDSLMSVSLMNEIQSNAGVDIAVADLLQGPSIVDIAAKILARLELSDGNEGEISDVSDMTDFAEEAKLEDDLRPVAAKLASFDAGAIFLTGATGFLGAFLLAELLQQTDREVVCLVRARNEAEGRRRLIANLAFYKLDPAPIQDRVRVIPGDLAKPHFGLSPAAFQSLAQQVATIYHNGATLNLTLPYQSLRSTNVAGTRSIIELACIGRAKPIHYVSSYSVLYVPGRCNGPAREDSELPLPEDLVCGYTQTKWVAETLLAAARSRGLPVTIYRPGNISGDSVTGAVNPFDMVHGLFRACEAIAALPDSLVEIDITPVDYIAKALVRISQAPRTANRVFHLTNPAPLQMASMQAWSTGAGSPIRIVPYQQWQTTLAAHIKKVGDGGEVMAAITDHLVPAALGENRQMDHLKLDCRNTLDVLAETDIRCPVLDRAYSRRCREFMRHALGDRPLRGVAA